MKNSNLGMPYMGSKRGIAGAIVERIKTVAPNAIHLYDLFGGGGAISFQSIKSFKTVHYNELNTGVVTLLRDIQKNGVSEKYYQWIDRETFDKNKKKDTWLGGLCKIVWSFGNNQRSYLYGKDIENIKKLAHNFIVNRCNKSRVSLEALLGFNYQKDNNLFDTEYNLHYARKKLYKLAGDRIIGLEHLQRIQLLERLDDISRLTITNLHYEDVEIDTPPSQTVIYLDPPYKNTQQYQLKINYEDLLEYINAMHKKGFTVIVSSYSFDGLKSIFETEHRSLLSSTNNSKKATEKLFTHKDFKFEEFEENDKPKPIQEELF